ncbi:MAG TPA: hypothetical protein DCR55_08680 [Lentisphaeria bacterium]|nr:hypothetical protein [Lentisphaeria bacterium]
MKTFTIQEIQGPGLKSPIGGQTVRTRGLITGFSRRGFFIQDPEPDANSAASCGLLVFGHHKRAGLGQLVRVTGKVVNYERATGDKPATQILLRDLDLSEEQVPEIEPVWLTAELLTDDAALLAERLNALEGMLVGLRAGATFIAPSNPFGDYVVLPHGADRTRQHECGGIVIAPSNPHRWFPGFRVIEYHQAPRVNVGARLLAAVTGPLNFRSSSYQIAATGRIEVEPRIVSRAMSALAPTEDAITVLTLNGFNLDVHVERRAYVNDPKRDVDDDVGDGRFRALAQAIVEQAGSPDIVALQEIQDNDGAEITETTRADQTYLRLIADVRKVGGPNYAWTDLRPERESDGGQPGGNIRCGFLYNPARVSLVEGSVQRLGVHAPAFRDSRKPLAATFLTPDGGALLLVNVHFASKRHQIGPFSPDKPGFDPKLKMRIEQCELIREFILPHHHAGADYYITGDFNDFEFSQPLAVVMGDESVNLVETLPELDRFDYNHRGKLHALMHGVVSRQQLAEGRAEYEILHGNELTGVSPGAMGTKPSDHAYVIARLQLKPATSSR